MFTKIFRRTLGGNDPVLELHYPCRQINDEIHVMGNNDDSAIRKKWATETITDELLSSMRVNGAK